MIRLILVVLAVVLYLIFSIPVLSYLKNLEKKDPKAAAKKSLDLVRWILGIVRDLAGITYEVRGLEHIPSDRAVLYVGNHRSYFDIVMGYTTVPEPTGISMWIFPEGTRNKSEDPADLMEFHEGSLKIAEKSGCPVIPVAITGTDDVFERHIPWIRKSHVIIEYGEPIYLKELPLDKKKFPGAYTREIISEMIKKQQQERAGK